MSISIDQLNQSSEDGFIEVLGSIFEHFPWAAEQVYPERPFSSGEQLHRAMVNAVRRSPTETRLALLRSHPQLAGREASAGTLTDASEREQAGAGLDQCSAEELAEIDTLNQRYLNKFEFPFIIAVTGLNRYQIMDAMKIRLEHSPEDEFEAANAEVEKIARIRIDALIDG